MMSKVVLRPIKKKDIGDLYELAKRSGEGMTTLPPNKKWLASEIERSVYSFQKKVHVPKNEKYMFALEDTELKRVVGVSAIEASVGGNIPCYSYKLGHKVIASHAVNVHRTLQILYLVNDYQNKTEICSLYLLPRYRVNKLGAFLSRARFLFMKLQPKRVTDLIFAEMRGYADDQKEPPFWRGYMQRFFPMSFHKASLLSVITNKQFIADLIPQYPIYVDLLPKYCQLIIGQPHKETIPAIRILEKEGFVYKNYVDIFDAGPCIETSFRQIRTIRMSNYYVITSIEKKVDGVLGMVCNEYGPFKAMLAHVNVTDNEIKIGDETARKLDLLLGDRVLAMFF